MSGDGISFYHLKTSNHSFLRGFFCQVTYRKTAWIMCISQICELARSRLVDWLLGSHMTTTTAAKLKSAFSFIFRKRLAESLLLKQGDIKYKLSMFWAVFRGRSRSEETLSCVARRRTEPNSGQRLNLSPAVVCGRTSSSWHLYIVSLLIACLVLSSDLRNTAQV